MREARWLAIVNNNNKNHDNHIADRHVLNTPSRVKKKLRHMEYRRRQGGKMRRKTNTKDTEKKGKRINDIYVQTNIIKYDQLEIRMTDTMRKGIITAMGE